MRRPLIILLSIVAVLAVVVLALPFLLDANRFRPGIEAELTKSLGRNVTIGDLNLKLFSGAVTARDVAIADDPAFSKTPFLSAKTLAFSTDVLPAIFQHKLNIKGATIDSPEITLIQGPSGQWNFSSMAIGSRPQPQDGAKDLAMSIRSLRVGNARISLNQGQQPRILDKVDVKVDDFAPRASFPFSLTAQMPGGGTLGLAGKAGPIDSANAADTPLAASVKIAGLNLAASGLAPAGSGLDALVSLDAMGNSSKGVLHLTGNLEAQKVKLASRGTPTRNPLQFTVDLTDDLNRHTGRMSRGDVTIGGVKAAITGEWAEQAAATVLSMNLSAANVPVSGIVDLLPALDIRLPTGSSLEGGTAAANLAIAGPASGPVVSGPVNVHNTRLKGFDLATQLGPVERLAGINTGPNTEIQTLSVTVRAAPDGTSLNDINIVVPALGEVTGAGTVSPAQALNFRMLASVRAGGLIGTGAGARIPFTITGTSASPQFRPDVSQLASQELNRQLKNVKVGGVDVGAAAGGILGGLLGGNKKK